MTTQVIRVSTPGRICLFGEHQDYLGLPVIAAAISCRVQLTVEPTNQRLVHLNLPDVGGQERFSLTEFPLAYQHGRDYFRSAVNVLRRKGFQFSTGIQGEVSGSIPINAGASSSSALLVGWLNVLSQLADNPRTLSALELAELAYAAEVLEFGEPGGMMDHYSTAVGGVIYLESQPTIRLETYKPALGSFVLGNSLEPKDTVGILSRVKHGMLRITDKLRHLDPAFSLQTTSPETLFAYRRWLVNEDYHLLAGTLANRDILRAALTLFREASPTNTPLNDTKLGQLLTEHHVNLRDKQRISTPKIDRMLDAALAAGALGGKINGSGGGGCMFVYAPTHTEAIAEAIEREGGKAYVVSVDTGTSSQIIPALATESVT